MVDGKTICRRCGGYERVVGEPGPGHGLFGKRPQAEGERRCAHPAQLHERPAVYAPQAFQVPDTSLVPVAADAHASLLFISRSLRPILRIAPSSLDWPDSAKAPMFSQCLSGRNLPPCSRSFG